MARFQLYHDDSISIWRTWYQFGGMDRGISMEEAADLPETRRRDFTVIVGLYLREKKKRRKDADHANGPK